jgi:hypothetical protein
MSLVFNSNLDARMAEVKLSPEVRQEINAQRIKVTGMQIPASVGAATRARLQQDVAESFVLGFRYVMGMAAILAALSALSALIIFRGKDAKIRRKTSA